MRYLFIVTEKNSANGICVNAVMKSLLCRGHYIDCISNREFGEPDAFQKDGIHYWGVRPRIVYRISSRLIRTKNKLWVSKLLIIIAYLINKIQLFFSIPSWPVISRSYSKRIFTVSKRLFEIEPYDYIIPTYTQIDTLIAAERIKKLHPSVKYIPYLLDSMAGGYGPKMFSKKWITKRGLKWEAKLFPISDQIIMMRSSKSFYDERKVSLGYYEKIVFLDIPLFMPKKNVETRVKRNDGIKHILYVGSIPVNIRNPLFFLEVFTSLKRMDVDLTIIGTSTCETMLNEYCTRDKRIRRIQQISHDEALHKIDEADILLNLGNNINTMMPSKVFEYMSSGKPIISTAPIKNEPCIPYLAKYDYALIIDESNTIESEIAKLDSFISNAKAIDPNKLRQKFSLNMPDAVVETINLLNK